MKISFILVLPSSRNNETLIFIRVGSGEAVKQGGVARRGATSCGAGAAEARRERTEKEMGRRGERSCDRNSPYSNRIRTM